MLGSLMHLQSSQGCKCFGGEKYLCCPGARPGLRNLVRPGMPLVGNKQYRRSANPMCACIAQGAKPGPSRVVPSGHQCFLLIVLQLQRMLYMDYMSGHDQWER